VRCSNPIRRAHERAAQTDSPLRLAPTQPSSTKRPTPGRLIPRTVPTRVAGCTRWTQCGDGKFASRDVRSRRAVRGWSDIDPAARFLDLGARSRLELSLGADVSEILVGPDQLGLASGWASNSCEGKRGTQNGPGDFLHSVLKTGLRARKGDVNEPISGRWTMALGTIVASRLSS
jgi:hypothetical protein